MPKNSPRTGPRPSKRAKTVEIPEVQPLQAGTQEPKRYATALDWAMEKLHDPDAPDDLKYRLTAVILPFQLPRLEARIGKKEREAESAKEKPSTAFDPAPVPPSPSSLRVQ